MLTPAQKFEFETIGRDSLYYGQFRYMTRFFLKEASCLRSSTHSEIKSILQMRSMWAWKHIEINDDIKKNVHTAFDQLKNITNPYKKTVYSNWVYFYTNDVDDINSLTNGPMKQVGSITQAVITHERGTVGHLDPKYKYRTYFTSHRPTPEQIETFHQFVTNCGDDVKISPGFKEWLNSNHRYWVLDHHYIDHNDTKILTMIALINPRLIRKTKPIVKVNN